MYNKILKIIIAISLAIATLNAIENDTSTDKTPQRWWEKGSYGYEETNKLLTHIEGSIGFSQTNGNDEDKSIKANIAAKVRKGHLGASISYSKTKEDRKAYGDKQDTTPQTSKRDDYQLSAVVGYDISKNFYVNLGYENSRNLTFEVYNHTTIYAGVGYRILTLEAHNLSVFLAAGTDDISFGTYPLLASGKTNGAYASTNYLWYITPAISLNVNYMFLKADMQNRDTSTLMAKVTVPISQNLFFIFGYKNDQMEVQKTINRYEYDKMFFTSIKFEF